MRMCMLCMCARACVCVQVHEYKYVQVSRRYIRRHVLMKQARLVHLPIYLFHSKSYTDGKSCPVVCAKT